MVVTSTACPFGGEEVGADPLLLVVVVELVGRGVDEGSLWWGPSGSCHRGGHKANTAVVHPYPFLASDG